MRQSSLRLSLILTLILVVASGAGAAELAVVDAGPTGLTFHSRGDHAALTLTVTGPEGFYHRGDLGDGGFDARGLADGVYRWELRATPALDAATREALARARTTGDEAIVERLRADGKLPSEALVQNGAFSVRGGAVVDAGLAERGAASDGARAGAETARSASGPRATHDPILQNLADEQLIAQNLYVQGSLCVGVDCVNNSAFGFQTIRLDENNLRIRFQDTSNTASFPTTDWEIFVNDSSNGGLSRFTISDVDAGRFPMTIEANARANALYVDDGGRVGFKTAAPAVDLHVVSGNTPTLRLQQDGSSGFTPQTWDVAGNEANFFIRDATNGSQLPLKIRPGADSNSLVIDNDNNVGVGILNATAALHVRRSSGEAQVLVDANTSSNFGGLRIENQGSGNIQTQFVNNNGNWEWRQNFRSTRLDFNFGTVGSVNTQFTLNSNGSAEFQGDVTANGVLLTSDRAAKQDFEPLDGEQILAAITALPVTSWSYKRDGGAIRHIGPVAQDFHAAFGVGPDDKHISPQDTASVALVGVQALNARLLALVEELEAKNAALEQRLEALEATMEP